MHFHWCVRGCDSICNHSYVNLDLCLPSVAVHVTMTAHKNHGCVIIVSMQWLYACNHCSTCNHDFVTKAVLHRRHWHSHDSTHAHDSNYRDCDCVCVCVCIQVCYSSCRRGGSSWRSCGPRADSSWTCVCSSGSLRGRLWM